MSDKKIINSWKLKTSLIFGFAAFFVAVLAFGIILVKNVNYIDARTTQQNAIVQTLADLQELRGDTKAAEANIKDAFLRDTEEFIHFYYEASGNYEDKLDSLEERLVPKPVTQVEFDDLRGIVERRYERLEELLAIYRQQGGQAALFQLRGKTIGVEINNHIDSSFANVIDKENKYLEQTENYFRRAERVASLILAALLLCILIFFGFSANIIRIVIVQETRARLLVQYNNSLETEVTVRTSELQEANKEMESFSYSVSHDLRAPLRAIEGFSNILMEDFGEKLGSVGEESITVIIRSVRQMSQLIDDILSFSRLGRKEILKTPTDLNKMVLSALEEIRRSQYFKGESSIKINDLGFANVDAGIFRQVFTNLIGNAVKFSSKKEQPEIQVGVLPNDPQTYYIRDNGVGFDMKHTNMLFNVFSRLHTSEEFDGTGVGLAIVKKIITKHGGKIWAESSPGLGATFYFSLP